MQTVRDAQKLLVYHKYANYYAQYIDDYPAVFGMIVRAIEMNETSCTLFKECSDADYGVTADDLEDIFERGIGGAHISIKRLLERQLTGYRHILKLRAADTLDCLQPSVYVSYILVWKRKAQPKIEDSPLSSDSNDEPETHS